MNINFIWLRAVPRRTSLKLACDESLNGFQHIVVSCVRGCVQSTVKERMLTIPQ